MRIEVAPARVTVCGRSDASSASGSYREDSSIPGAWNDFRLRLHLMVVCLEDPALAGNRRGSEELQERCGVVCRLWKGIRVIGLTNCDVVWLGGI